MNKRMVPIIVHSTVLLIGIIMFYSSYSIMQEMIESRGFNGLMLLFMPNLWGIFIGPVIGAIALYELIFSILIYFNENNKKLFLLIKWGIIFFFFLFWQLTAFIISGATSIILLGLTAIIGLRMYMIHKKTSKKILLDEDKTKNGEGEVLENKL